MKHGVKVKQERSLSSSPVSAESKVLQDFLANSSIYSPLILLPPLVGERAGVQKTEGLFFLFFCFFPFLQRQEENTKGPIH